MYQQSLCRRVLPRPFKDGPGVIFVIRVNLFHICIQYIAILIYMRMVIYQQSLRHHVLPRPSEDGPARHTRHTYQ